MVLFDVAKWLTLYTIDQISKMELFVMIFFSTKFFGQRFSLHMKKKVHLSSCTTDIPLFYLVIQAKSLKRAVMNYLTKIKHYGEEDCVLDMLNRYLILLQFDRDVIKCAFGVSHSLLIGTWAARTEWYSYPLTSLIVIMV